MKKSELRKLIKEQIQNLREQISPPGGYFCMNDAEQTGVGYCVSQMPLAPDGMTIQSGGTGGQDVYEAMQNAGMGVWAQHATLEDCFAAGICSENYLYSAYPPPTGGVGPIGPGGVKGPQGNLYTNYADKPKGMATTPSGMAPMSKKRGIKMAPAKRMMRKQIREMVKKLIMEMPTYSTATEAKNNCWMGNGDCLDGNGNMLACSQSLNVQTNTFSNNCGAPIQGGGTMTPGKDVRPSGPMKPKTRRNRRRR